MKDYSILYTVVRYIDAVKQSYLAGLIIVALCFMAGLGGWSLLQKKQVYGGSINNSSKLIQLYENNRQELLGQANFNGEAALKTIWEVIKKREVEMAGWTLKTITCKSTHCEELWQNDSGSFQTLSERVQAHQTIDLHPNGEDSLITYALAGNKSALHHTSLPKKESLWDDLIHKQAHLKNASTDLAFDLTPPEILGLTHAMMSAVVPTHKLLYAGYLTLKAPLGLVDDILKNHLKHVMIEEISISHVGDIHGATIHIKGTYYAQH